MLKKLFTTTIALSFIAVLFSSYEHGPAHEGGLNRTGSTGGAANCAGSGCHAANDPSTIVRIEVRDVAGNLVTSYAPGTTYNVSIVGSNSLSTSLPKFGFQVSAVRSGASQGGTFAAISGTDVRVTNLGGLQIVEHKDELDEASPNHYVALFTWTAPAVGTGNVTFYGILNALGDDGHKPTDDDDDDDDDDGDNDASYPNIAPPIVLTEGLPNKIESVERYNFKCFPNPCIGQLTISNVEEAHATLLVTDLNGRCVFSTEINSSQLVINTTAWAPGLYFMSVDGNINIIAKQ